MLETIDLLVGLAVVMLVVSFAVTVVTQLFVSLLNLRGAALLNGVTRLLVLIDNELSGDTAKQIARQILLDPLVAQPGALRSRLAQVVHREELTKLLLRFTTLPTSPSKAAGATQKKFEELQLAMRTTLRNNDIGDAEATLKAIRRAALALEKTQPEMSNSDRTNLAILSFGDSDFIGKLYAWFDQTMDRVSDTFTTRTRVTSIVVAVFIAFGLQLDTIGLINRLSTDKSVRSQLVDWATKNPDAFAPDATPPPTGPKAAATPRAGAPAPAAPAPRSHAPGQSPIADAARETLTSQKLIVLPTSFDVWMSRWSGPVACAPATSGKTSPTVDDGCPLPKVDWAGVLLSATLLSLGGPFWYEALKNLLRLRSLVATKDDDQRQDRQTTQPSTTTAAVKSKPSVLASGEAGDLITLG